MPKFLARAKDNGGLDMSEYQRMTMQQYIKDNKGSRMRLVLEKETPESRNQRKFYHGAILPLWAYLDGKDYKSPHVLEQLHEVAKLEFNAEIIIVHGVEKRVGKTTKGELNEGYVEKLIDYLIDNYGIDPAKVLDPEKYKHWRDAIYPFTTKYDTFIEYMISLGDI